MCSDNSAMAAEAPVEFWADMKPKLGMRFEDARARIPADVAIAGEEASMGFPLLAAGGARAAPVGVGAASFFSPLRPPNKRFMVAWRENFVNGPSAWD